MALRFASCLYLALLFPLVSSSALPPPPQDTPEGHEALFESSQVREVSVLPSLSNTWSLPSSTPAASFDEVEEQFKNLTTFKPPTCNGAAYGRGLSPESCHEALLAIPHETRQLIFGKRGRGRWNINLPYRVLSSDGTCAIEVIEPTFGFSDQASGYEIVRAAWAVITSCVGDNKREGGIAEKIGFGRRLSVKVFTYDSHVRCTAPGQSPAPVLTACDSILDQMPADKNEKVFGTEGFPYDVKIPVVYRDSTNGCNLVIQPKVRGEEVRDLTSWYDIWGAAIAVRQQCVMQQRAGQADNVGKRGGHLLVQLRPTPETAQQRDLAVS